MAKLSTPIPSPTNLPLMLIFATPTIAPNADVSLASLINPLPNITKVTAILAIFLTISNPPATPTQTPSEELDPIASFANSELADNSYGGWTGTAYSVLLYEGNLYKMIKTELTYAYSMVLGTTSVTTYGTYVDNGSEDGYAKYTLNAGAEAIVASYSLAGGYSILVNTADEEQTYPAELPAKTQGEKNMAQGKEDVIADFGQGNVIYAQEGKNNFTFVDPNDESATKQTISTASGDASALLGKTFDSVQIVNEFDGTKGEDGNYSAWNGSVLQVITYADGSYEFQKTTINYGYSMLLATTFVETVGKVTKGASEDGFSKMTLNVADDVLLDSYSLAGGFNIHIDTRNQTYPVELPAQTQGEKNMAQGKDDVIKAYGQEQVFYFNESGVNMSLTDPNA